MGWSGPGRSYIREPSLRQGSGRVPAWNLGRWSWKRRLVRPRIASYSALRASSDPLSASSGTPSHLRHRNRETQSLCRNPTLCPPHPLAHRRPLCPIRLELPAGGRLYFCRCPHATALRGRMGNNHLGARLEHALHHCGLVGVESASASIRNRLAQTPRQRPRLGYRDRRPRCSGCLRRVLDS